MRKSWRIRILVDGIAQILASLLWCECRMRRNTSAPSTILTSAAMFGEAQHHRAPDFCTFMTLQPRCHSRSSRGSIRCIDATCWSRQRLGGLLKLGRAIGLDLLGSGARKRGGHCARVYRQDGSHEGSFEVSKVKISDELRPAAIDYRMTDQPYVKRKTLLSG